MLQSGLHKLDEPLINLAFDYASLFFGLFDLDVLISFIELSELFRRVKLVSGAQKRLALFEQHVVLFPVYVISKNGSVMAAIHVRMFLIDRNHRLRQIVKHLPLSLI